jgi:hypothetical protein
MEELQGPSTLNCCLNWHLGKDVILCLKVAPVGYDGLLWDAIWIAMVFTCWFVFLSYFFGAGLGFSFHKIVLSSNSAIRYYPFILCDTFKGATMCWCWWEAFLTHVTNVSSFLRLLFSYCEKVHIKHPASVSNGYAVTWKQKLPPKRGKLLFFLK